MLVAAAALRVLTVAVVLVIAAVPALPSEVAVTNGVDGRTHMGAVVCTSRGVDNGDRGGGGDGSDVAAGGGCDDAVNGGDGVLPEAGSDVAAFVAAAVWNTISPPFVVIFTPFLYF